MENSTFLLGERQRAELEQKRSFCEEIVEAFSDKNKLIVFKYFAFSHLPLSCGAEVNNFISSALHGQVVIKCFSIKTSGNKHSREKKHLQMIKH